MEWVDLNSFLIQCKQKQISNLKGDLVIVFGNEACDLDSIISALMYAQFLQVVRGFDFVVPLLLIPREDLLLRTEVVWFLQSQKIELKNLQYFDEWKEVIQKRHSEKLLKVVLVDHNLLSEGFKQYADAVIEVFDHHVDSHSYLTSRRVLEMVGSCTTLIAEQILDALPDFGPKTSQEALQQMATLILGTILLDTVFLDPKFKKVTPKDESISKKLKTISKMSNEEEKKMFLSLQEQRFDVSSLCNYDLLRLDFKQDVFGSRSVRIGISSVKRSIHEFLQRDQNLLNDLARWTQKQNLTVLYVMCAYVAPPDVFTRELMVYAPEAHRSDFESSIRFLQSSSLGLQSFSIAPPYQSGHLLQFFSQSQIDCSRKQLQPLLQTFFSK